MCPLFASEICSCSTFPGRIWDSVGRRRKRINSRGSPDRLEWTYLSLESVCHLTPFKLLKTSLPFECWCCGNLSSLTHVGTRALSKEEIAERQPRKKECLTSYTSCSSSKQFVGFVGSLTYSPIVGSVPMYQHYESTSQRPWALHRPCETKFHWSITKLYTD